MLLNTRKKIRVPYMQYKSILHTWYNFQRALLHLRRDKFTYLSLMRTNLIFPEKKIKSKYSFSFSHK